MGYMRSTFDVVKSEKGVKADPSRDDMWSPPPIRSWISSWTSFRLPKTPGLMLRSHPLKAEGVKAAVEKKEEAGVAFEGGEFVGEMGAMRES